MPEKLSKYGVGTTPYHKAIRCKQVELSYIVSLGLSRRARSLECREKRGVMTELFGGLCTQNPFKKSNGKTVKRIKNVFVLSRDLTVTLTSIFEMGLGV